MDFKTIADFIVGLFGADIVNKIVGLAIIIAGIMQYIKITIPESFRNRLKWYVLGIAPIVIGVIVHFISPQTYTILDGIVSGVLSTVGYKGLKELSVYVIAKFKAPDITDNK